MNSIVLDKNERHSHIELKDKANSPAKGSTGEAADITRL